MSKRAVLYSRVSGDDTRRDGRNVRNQLDMDRDHAIAKGYDIVGEFHADDHGASGAAFELPELNKIRGMAELFYILAIGLGFSISDAKFAHFPARRGN